MIANFILLKWFQLFPWGFHMVVGSPNANSKMTLERDRDRADCRRPMSELRWFPQLLLWIRPGYRVNLCFTFCMVAQVCTTADNMTLLIFLWSTWACYPIHFYFTSWSKSTLGVMKLPFSSASDPTAGDEPLSSEASLFGHQVDDDLRQYQ